MPHSQADNTLLRSLFPDVEPVELDDGLAATVAWMRSVVADAGATGSHRSVSSVVLDDRLVDRAPGILWRLTADRVMTHRIDAPPETAANDLVGPVALVWLALDNTGTQRVVRPVAEARPHRRRPRRRARSPGGAGWSSSTGAPRW